MNLTNTPLYKLNSHAAKIIAILMMFALPFQSFAQDQVYIQRLAALRSQTELIYNPEVKKHIESYIQNPAKTRDLIALSKYYFPVLEKHLRAKGLPIDLKYLAVSSSELNPTFSNANGASGIWTMSFTVSKMYKLKVNTYVDERRDINKSSAVFAQHFKDLYSIYKQWSLVIGAYGCSPISMNKSIRMAGNSLYYWDIFNYLPTNCRDLYPQFVAATYILNYYKEHGIKATAPDLVYESDSVLVNKWLSLAQIANTLSIDLDELRKLNPMFKKDVIPMSADGYYIKIPKNKSKLFYLLNDSVYRPIITDVTPIIIQKEEPQDHTSVITENVPDVVNPNIKKTNPKKNKIESETEPKSQKLTKVYYVVKRGDVLSDIADWFDCSNADIKKWNKLKSNKVQKGKKLTIFVVANKTGYYKRINKMTTKQKKKLKKKD
ncbi:MAG: LysM peptidoglycan-binding domain-containing protein [Bacteroidia bacterium]|nr:LysM peptidoglycan-binding domain-containing protein [Bacteroidia bacterium]